MLVLALMAWGAVLWANEEVIVCSDVMDRLEQDGFENVRAVREGGILTVALEDHHYRGIHHGLAQALRLIDAEVKRPDRDTIVLVALQDGMPRLTLHAVHADKQWEVSAEPGGHLPASLHAVQPRAKGWWKVDVVPYPTLSLNDRYLVYSGDYGWERFWCIEAYLGPALEVTPWRGARLTLQEHVLLWYNDKASSPQRLMPGYMTLQQRLVSTRKVEATATLGLLGNERNGVLLQADWHLRPVEMGWLGHWQADLGVQTGWTGPWYLKEDTYVPTVCRWDKVLALAHVNLFETRTHSQLELRGGRFMLGDWGVRLDAQRHFHERSIGVYLTWCERCVAAGFDFSLPIGPWKRGRHRRVNLRLPETYYFTFGDAMHGDRQTNDHDLPAPKSGPQDNYSAGLWQAEMIGEWVKEELGNQ